MTSTKNYDPLQIAEADAVDHAVPHATATPVIKVLAPADLPEGYTFDAQVDEGIVKITVPLGGVECGQEFSVPIASSSCDGASHIPVGAWRDGLCDCCTYGCCHTHMCLSWWFPPLMLAQVMTRMQLNWFGDNRGPAEAMSTFKIFLFLTVALISLSVLLNAIAQYFLWKDVGGVVSPENLSLENVPPEYTLLTNIRGWFNLVFGIFLIIVMTKTRAYIRNKFAIPERTCHGCEDCCCSYWCTCCTVAQMARHTADYDTYHASCCTETGLPAHVPAIVV